MVSISFPILRSWIAQDLTDIHAGASPFSCHGDMRLFHPDTAPEPFILYAGVSQDLAAFIGHVRRFPDVRLPFCYLCCGCDPNKKPAVQSALPVNCSVLYSEKSLPAVFNKMADKISRFIRWNDALKNVLYRNEGVQALLDLSSFLPGTLLLTNAGYKLQASVYKEDVSDPTVDEVRQLGYHTFETIERIHKEVPLVSSQDTSEYISKVSNNYTIIRLIRYKERIAARLCLILNGPDTDPAYSDYMAILGNAVAEYLFSKQSVDYASNAELGSLVADIIEGRIVNQNELDQRMKQVKLIAHR